MKIDRSFVKDLDTEPESLHLVETILRLAQGLGLSVVAEGIETREQLAKLASLGCGYGQGYYFSRPADGQFHPESHSEDRAEEHASVGP